MTQFRTVTDSMSVSPQLCVTDIDEAASMGVCHIINNRPDGESADQPTNAALCTYAENKGIRWTFIPIVPGQVTADAVAQTSVALKMNEKTLAFCRSGTRSCNLWGLSQAYAGTEEIPVILQKASAAGYDLSGITPALEQLRADAK
ncbi:MAG: TIGR01244 family phosphatase [Kordiimonadaceae bacterium]|nr:TIGR01244 family phosphatase [Kordiimonadaceae bacterium]